MIDFTKEAKEFEVGGETNKEIIKFFGTVPVQIETYNPIKVKFLLERGEIIVDRTIGKSVPDEVFKRPIVSDIISMIQLERRLR